ncbi:uncharacterized protein LOC123701432 [Colias croceus]|uniref:uncharacterized protein LOC123701432 n=1 Tax=Colias crocea TaxID=72248 RepID=UPI001E27B06C|nr:uncharacterized protein LOC123701432 [Colias croceus]
MDTVGQLNSGPRKKQRKDRSTYKKKTYTDKDPLGINFKQPCQHKTSSKFKCSSVTLRNVIKNRKLFFAQNSKVKQDVYLTRLMTSYEPQRRRGGLGIGLKNRKMSCSYHLLSKNNKMVTVCKEFFKVTFSVTNKRLQTINTSTYKGDLPQENRGGDRRSTKSEEKKQSLRNFLKALPAKESHYNRLKSKRIYLSSELNGAKLLRYYNSSVPANLRVSRSMFYDIFYKDFNIGFSCPSSDACNVCTLWSYKIKNECDPAKKQILMVEKRVHKLRANAFYQYMKDEVEGSISFCFDLQQVQPLPRTPIQDAFYSRQVSLYNFCIVDLKSKKPTFFTWNETQASRGSVEIGSALYTYLNGLDIPAEITTLRLFCDGCGGQNKNNHIIHMLLFWLHNNAPPHLRQINLTFPVRGHSFLPADRVGWRKKLGNFL